MPELDPKNVPAPLVRLLPMAETWGIRDDFERDNLVRQTTPKQLEVLVHSIDDISDDDLFGWLSGPSPSIRTRLMNTWRLPVLQWRLILRNCVCVS